MTRRKSALLPVGTKVQSTDDLFTLKAWPEAGKRHLKGEVVGHLHGYNMVIFRKPNGEVFPIGTHPHWLATNDELTVLTPEETKK